LHVSAVAKGLGPIMNRTRAGLLAAVSSLALVSPVAAADMPVKARPVVVVAPSWAGLYIGASVGAVWHELKYEDLTFPPVTSARGRKAGIIGGGHIGYNWQSNNFVYGVEADISGSSAKVTLRPFGAGAANETDTSRLHWLATFRARAGVTVGSGNTLLFATGGLALGGVENLRTFPVGITPAEVGEGKATRTGWVAGGGIEHMLSRNWIVRAEALYVDLGDKTINTPTNIGTYRTRFTNTEVVARGAVLFKW
jgi:outer membrane immunogenic protein